MLSARDIRLVRDGAVLLDGPSLDVQPGRVHALLGGNGAGKSSLLRVLAGDWRPDGGSVVLDGGALAQVTPAALAARRAVLPQLDELRYAVPARDVVALGRLAVAGADPAAEAHFIDESLAATDTLHLADAPYTRLSAGERARVQLARVLAQVAHPAATARYLLLDEPTAALDLAHRHACLQLCRAAAARGLGVLVVLHDLDLATRYADDVTLLRRGRTVASGPAVSALTVATLRECFGGELVFERIEHAGTSHWWADLAVDQTSIRTTNPAAH